VGILGLAIWILSLALLEYLGIGKTPPLRVFIGAFCIQRKRIFTYTEKPSLMIPEETCGKPWPWTSELWQLAPFKTHQMVTRRLVNGRWLSLANHLEPRFFVAKKKKKHVALDQINLPVKKAA